LVRHQYSRYSGVAAGATGIRSTLVSLMLARQERSAMAGDPIPPGAIPSPAALVRDFVNTIDHELGTDELATADGLSDFLHTHELLPATARADERDRATAVRLRDGLHEALRHNHDGRPGPVDAPVKELDEVLSQLPVRLLWSGDGVAVGPTDEGADGALAQIALAAHRARAAEVWWRLKICAFDECEWAFYDLSKNRSRHYCEYGCGNKLKTRAYRARRREQAAR
jgi:predicted RNA-binding Zn ribbon-like protein